LHHLVESVRRSVREKNWYAALSGALSLPDIAGKLDQRKGGSQKRFVKWFNVYLLPKYKHKVGMVGRTHVFLSGEDCYALRCAYLHEGDFDITGQRARKILARFDFVVPSKGGRHRNHNETSQRLELQVNMFCEDVCIAVENWLAARGSKPKVAAAIARMPTIDFS